jgi:polysaccharide export outer membrane protein
LLHLKRATPLVCLAIALLLMALGCGTTGPYVWARDLKPEEVGSADYSIVVGDLLSVKVFNQEPMSTHAKVRSDGKIAMPFLGDVVVLGKSPTVVAREIEAGLKSFVNAPNVTVVVDEFQPTTVTVIGEVGKPGAVSLERNSGVLQALAAAGGLTENASRDDIFLLREAPAPRRIRFTYDSLVLYPPTQTFRLRPGDIIVVE